MIDKLEFVIALAREQHFGRAAETCNVSQPTLSAGIKQLEDTFGVLLVQRGSRFRGFTTEGERVLEWARRIVADTRAMRQEVDALKRGLAGHVQIAAIPTALAMTAMLTTPYRAKHPNVRFTIVSRNSIQVLGMLENLEGDAGLTYVDNEPLGLTESVRSIPIIEPAATQAIGLVIPERDQTTPLIKALVAEARQLAILFNGPSQPASQSVARRRASDEIRTAKQ